MSKGSGAVDFEKELGAVRPDVSAISILAAADLPMLPEMLARDPSIGMVLSGSKSVDWYVRRAYPWMRVVRVDSQRCRLPLRLLLGFWAGRRIGRRTVPDKVYLVAPYFCAAVMTAIGRHGVGSLSVNRHEDTEDPFREHEPRTPARRLALRFMQRILKLPVTYYSWGAQDRLHHVVGLTRPFVERTEPFHLSHQECDRSLMERIDVPLGSGPHLVWMLSGWEHDLTADFPEVFARVNREFRRRGYTLRLKQHPTFNLPRGARESRIRRIPRYLPGDLIRFPNRTVIIGMFSTALTAYPELPVVSIAKLCRPRKDEMFLILIDQVRRLSTAVRFVESIDELLDKAGQHMRKGV